MEMRCCAGKFCKMVEKLLPNLGLGVPMLQQMSFPGL